LSSKAVNPNARAQNEDAKRIKKAAREAIQLTREIYTGERAKEREIERVLLRDYVTNEPLRRRVVRSNQGIEKVNERLQGKEIRSGNEAGFVASTEKGKKNKKSIDNVKFVRARANRLHLKYLTAVL